MGGMMDHDAFGYSLILTSLKNLAWTEKRVRVATSGPKLPGKIDVEES
jgi:hypothetical protein